MKTMHTMTIVSWVLRLSAAAILLQTLFFKFTGSAESIHIFTRMGAEPWGRIGSGVVELLAAILLIVPKTAPLGGLVAAGVMAGAIGSHLTVLGIEVLGDRGLLFGLAVYVFAASIAVLVLHRTDLPLVGQWFEHDTAVVSMGGRQ